jgi:hypothetical protein
MATVIDALVVELELDTSQYKRSWKDVDAITDEGDAKRDRVNKKNDKEERERARRQKQETLDRKKHTDELAGSVLKLGTALAGAFLGFESLGGAVKYFGELNSTQAALGRTATRIGTDARSLNTYGKAVEFAGGKADDAASSFGKLAEEFSTFKISGGTPGPLLQLLTQKGVNFRDVKGNLLDMGTIFSNLSKQTQNMDAQDRANLFARAGISQGLIDFMLEESKLQDEQLEKARAFNAVTEQSAKNAEHLTESWRGVGQAVDKSGNAILSIISPKVSGFLDLISSVVGGTSFSAQSFRDLFGGQSAEERQKAAEYKYNTKRLQDGLAANGGKFPDAPSGVRNNNPGNIKAVGDQARDSRGFRIFDTLAEGQAAMRSNLERKIDRGNDTILKLIAAYEGTDAQKDPTATAAYINRVSRITGKDANAPITKADLPEIIRAMVAVESGTRDSALRIPGATPSITSGAKRDAAGAAGGNTTNVTVNKIEVNSSAADPTQVANATGDALTRKITVAQANAGQQ